MPFEDEFGLYQVDYSYHFAQYAAPFITGQNAENDYYFANQAKEMHALSVGEALRQLLEDALFLREQIQLTQKTDYLLRFGVMRRLGMLTSAFRDFRSIIMPDRTKPLSSEQANDVCRDLNAIYINVLGMLDNYAWAMVQQAGAPATRAANQGAIGIFMPRFIEDQALASVAARFQPFKDWFDEVKERRNPAAHRMPLYVPPAGLTSQDVEKYKEYEALISAALRDGEYDKMEGLRAARDGIGTFIPNFLHDPAGQVMEIYPTLPHDIAQMIKIGRIAQTFIREQGSGVT
jgi:hypothetical protein